MLTGWCEPQQREHGGSLCQRVWQLETWFVRIRPAVWPADCRILTYLPASIQSAGVLLALLELCQGQQPPGISSCLT